ncbi:hypothetical protein H0H87_011991 [Tephrocybe sp. NHM501043]|nr:hypothetical protein H0H87_011991 [Tephrocybe sp. NHM501043]
MAASTSQTRKRTTRAIKQEMKPMRSKKPKPKPKSTPKTTSRETSTDGTANDRDEDYRSDSDDEEDAQVDDAYDSDAIDEDEFIVGTKRKRRASSSVARSPSKKTTSASLRKNPRAKKARKQEEEEGEEEEDRLELEDGQEVVGVVVQAPKSGQGLPFHFNIDLEFIVDPACNDRQWFKLHEPVYRQAENEWKAFIEALTEHLTEADPQVPPLPPKDLIHRIYRDVRFSNDKTPYKKGFSASFSRSGRKGIWAGYHVASEQNCLGLISPLYSTYRLVKPGNESILAAGSWCPGRSELANIRANILRPAGADRLREVLANPEFVTFFGEPQPGKDGARQSVFGMDDELKVAPKGVDKNHRSVCVFVQQ